MALSSFNVTLDGIGLQLVAAPDDPDNPEIPAGYSGGWVPQEGPRQFVKRDVPVYIRRFNRGAGFVEMRDEDDDGGYAWLEDADGWSGNGIRPSGRRVTNAVNGAGTDVRVLDSVVFDGDLWLLTDGNKVVHYGDCDPTASPTLIPAAGQPFNGAFTGFRSGYVGKSIAVFRNASGVAAIYIGTYNSGTGESRIYEYTVSGGWAESNVLGFRADNMAVVWWEGRDGTGAYRLLLQVDDRTVRHCIAGSNPLLAASYVTPIEVADPGYVITRLVAAPGHAYAVTTGGIMDFNELRVWNLTPYWREGDVFNNGAAGLVYDDGIIATRGFGLDRYNLRLGDGVQQRVAGEVGVGAYWQEGTPLRGYHTALATHDGWLLAAVYNPNNLKTYICRAKDRRALDVSTPNQFVWHGAEQVISSSGVGLQVTHMRVVAPTVAPSVVLPARTAYLWMAVAATNNPVNIGIMYAPLPTGSGALSVLASGGSFEFNPTARAYFTAQTWLDRNADKGVMRYDFVSRDVTATSTIELKSRADGPPATITDQTTWTSQGTATSNSKSITPTSGITGKSIALQAVLTTPSPYTAPPILHELSPRARVVREAFEVRKIWIVLGRDYGTQIGTRELADADETFAAVAEKQNQAAPSTYVDELNRTYSVSVEQGVEFRRLQIEDRDWRTVAGFELTLRSAA